MDPKDKRMLLKIKSISDRGNNAEVKRDKDGSWVIYEVKKKKTKVG